MHAHDRSSRTPAPNEQKKAARRTPHGLLALQRSIGNEAVTALLRAEEEHAHDEGCGHDPTVQRTAVDAGLRTPGLPLPGATLARKEGQFQADFSGVRVHTGPAAAQAAAAVQARAFTVHQDIVLGEQGNDPEVLDHELTHVVRNQQGATAGHDTGGGFSMTHPNDSVEREAASNAARMRSGGPSAVVGGTPTIARAPATPAPAAVQRWAFADGQQIQPDTDGLTSKMKKWVEDDKVRDYQTRDGTPAIKEFKDHTEGHTDYLGNLPGPASAGTWVRFERNGTNVIGEDHTAVKLGHVLGAVESTSFVYEAFVTEKLDKEPNTKKAYQAEQRSEAKQLPMADKADWSTHGAESLYPKMGHAMAQLLGELKHPASLEKLGKNGSDHHLGQVLQRYLKIAWQYGKDMQKQQSQPNQGPARTSLAKEYTRLKHPDTTTGAAFRKIRSAFDKSKDLNEFIKGLPTDGYLGDALATDEAKNQYVEPLEEYAKAIIEETLERTGGPAPGRNNEPPTSEDKRDELGARRDASFEKAVTEAASNKVRYAGMGADHLKALIEKGVLPGPAFKMAHKDLGTTVEGLIDPRRKLTAFEELTEQRKGQAQSGQ